MSTNNILFVFEGEKTEKLIVTSLEKHIFHESTVIKSAFAADIYQLYREIEDDNDLDIFNLIKEKNVSNFKILDNYSRADFAEIYLFFDYDAHASLASPTDRFGNVMKDGDEKIKEMLAFFDNETDKGKLYISYPMVEAVRHIIDYGDFKDLKVKCKGQNCQHKEVCKDKEACNNEPSYKQRVSSESISTLCNINGYTEDTWKRLIESHLCKMNHIVNDTYILPNKIESQLYIFTKQLDKYIQRMCPMVAVLSAFPIFIFDYYGYKKTTTFLS